jgi:hypothetical protein
VTQFGENLLPRLVGTAAEVHLEPAGPIPESKAGWKMGFCQPILFQPQPIRCRCTPSPPNEETVTSGVLVMRRMLERRITVVAWLRFARSLV